MEDRKVIGTAICYNRFRKEQLELRNLQARRPGRKPGVFFYLPILPGEWINNLLLDSLLASDLEALVLAYSHYLTSLKGITLITTISQKIYIIC